MPVAGRAPLHPWLATVGLLLAVALTAALTAVLVPDRGRSTVTGHPGPPPTHPTAPPTGFGGYDVVGTSVGEIAAHWRVPAVLAGSPPGSASTWIGAQGMASPSGGYAFVQVGTTEAEGDFGPGYAAFWSSTAVGFHPISFGGAVHRGDDVVASMRQAPGGWVVRIRDRTAGWSQVVHTSYGRGLAFSDAEWTQEDPFDPATGTDAPYPRLEAPTFRSLELNGRSVPLSYSQARVLAPVNGAFLVPTRGGNDGFGFFQPRGVARRYLVDRAAVVRAQARCVGIGPAAVTSRQRLALLTCRADAAAAMVQMLGSQHWPHRLRPLISREVAADLALRRAELGWRQAGSADSPRWRSAAYRDERRVEHSVVVIATRLGLPPTL